MESSGQICAGIIRWWWCIGGGRELSSWKRQVGSILVNNPPNTAADVGSEKTRKLEIKLKAHPFFFVDQLFP